MEGGGQVGQLEFLEDTLSVDMIWRNVNILNNYLNVTCKKAVPKSQKQSETNNLHNKLGACQWKRTSDNFKQL